MSHSHPKYMVIKAFMLTKAYKKYLNLLDESRLSAKDLRSDIECTITRLRSLHRSLTLTINAVFTQNLLPYVRDTSNSDSHRLVAVRDCATMVRALILSRTFS